MISIYTSDFPRLLKNGLAVGGKFGEGVAELICSLSKVIETIRNDNKYGSRTEIQSKHLHTPTNTHSFIAREICQGAGLSRRLEKLGSNEKRKLLTVA